MRDGGTRALIGVVVVAAHVALGVLLREPPLQPRVSVSVVAFRPLGATSPALRARVPGAEDPGRRVAPGPRPARPGAGRPRPLARATIVAPARTAAAPRSLPGTVAAPVGAASDALRIDGEVLRRAARDAIRDTPGGDAPRSRGQVLEGKISEAGVPGCLDRDAMKHEPVRLAGLLGLPILAHAALSGRCR